MTGLPVLTNEGKTETTGFSCPRSCRWAEKVDICRFMPILEKMVDRVVDSHTTRVEFKIKDRDILISVISRYPEIKLIGEGAHQLYSGPVHGFAFHLPGWKYPVVLSKDTLYYDNYGGRWGDQSVLDRILSEYKLALVESECLRLGWMYQTDLKSNSVTVYHPDGGTLTIHLDKDVVIDANGFVGSSCHEAAASFVSKFGQALEVTEKPSSQLNNAVIQQLEG